MCLQTLPTELLLMLPSFLKTERDISSLSRASTQLYLLLTPGLYRHNSCHSASSSLLWAATNGNETTARLSLRERGDVETRDEFGRTPLSRAAHHGHEAVVKLILETEKVNLDSKDAEGRTALFWAAANGHEAIVKLLIQKGSDVTTKDMIGWTVLFWPAANGHEAVVDMLLATQRVNVDSKDAEGRTPLYMAAARGHQGVVRLLVEYGKADLLSKDSQGRSLSYWPALNGYKSIAEYLGNARRSRFNLPLVVS